MRTINWTATTSDRAAALGAGGRRRYNAERQAARELRRAELARLLSASSSWRECPYAALAVRLRVSRPTFCRETGSVRGTFASSAGSGARLRLVLRP